MMALEVVSGRLPGIGTTSSPRRRRTGGSLSDRLSRGMGTKNYHSEWGHLALQFMKRVSTGNSTQTYVRYAFLYWRNLSYCIEVGVDSIPGDVFTSHGENFLG